MLAIIIFNRVLFHVKLDLYKVMHVYLTLKVWWSVAFRCLSLSSVSSLKSEVGLLGSPAYSSKDAARDVSQAASGGRGLQCCPGGGRRGRDQSQACKEHCNQAEPQGLRKTHTNH